jgi:hypothetical protein
MVLVGTLDIKFGDLADKYDAKGNDDECHASGLATGKVTLEAKGVMGERYYNWNLGKPWAELLVDIPPLKKRSY